MTSSGFSFDVPHAPRLSRLLIFFKLFLIIPHALVLGLFAYFAGVVSLLSFWAILLLGRFPQGMWNVLMSFCRWSARVQIYLSLLRDEYPPFGEQPYPMTLTLDHPRRSSRFLLLARMITIIPIGIWRAVLAIWFGPVLLFAWFTILVTGRLPLSLHEHIVGILRYNLKSTMYVTYMTDDWPGFNLDS